jgi:DNA repair exonuclease SbcCD ATPase subunit
VYQDLTTSSIDAINHYLDQVVPHFYDRDIQLRLITSRAGSKGRTNIDLEVTVDGAECDITSLSGGERVRASLAIYLACHSFVDPPLLILDEPLNSIDDEWCDTIAEYLRDYFGRRMCLITSYTLIGQYLNAARSV